MNKRLFLLFAAFIPTFVGAQAEEEACEACDPCAPPCLEFTLSGNTLTAADFENEGFEGQELTYSEADGQASYTYIIDSCNGLALGAGMRYTYLKWEQNPHFNDRKFYDAHFSAVLYSRRWEGWYWRAGALAHLDSDHLDEGAYHKYQGLLWGRYHYSDCLGLHIGAMGGLGMHDDYVYPILGIDYSPYCDWKLNLIFPVNVSAVYSLNDCLDLDIAIRRLRARHRVDETEVLTRGIFEYRSYGVELGASVHLNDCFLMRLYAGSTGGGTLEVMDHHGRDVATYSLDGAAYMGGNVTLQF